MWWSSMHGDTPTTTRHGWTGKAPVSVVVPTRNEERNLRECLLSVVPWAGEVFVLDSYSDDRTVAIAEEMGARVAQRHFDSFSAQKNWALDRLPFRHDWVFFLDADERATPPLRDEICSRMADPAGLCDGYYMGRKNYFMGQWVRHGGWYPNWQLRLFKHRLGRYEDRIVHEHVILEGRVGYLKTPLLHQDYKGLERYFDRHNVYSSMEAIEAYRLFHPPSKGHLKPSLFTRGPGRRRFLKEAAYRYLPARPLFKFLWMYLGQGGILDGRIGFRYCVLQSFYEYQVSLKLLELRTHPTSPLQVKYGRPHPAEGGTGERMGRQEAARHAWKRP